MAGASSVKTVLVAVALLIGLPVCAMTTCNLMWWYSWRDNTPRGPLVNVTDWPEPIQDLYTSLGDAGIDTSSFSVYLLYGQPAQLSSSVACRMDTDETAWHKIQQKLDLDPISESHGESLRTLIIPRASPSWWPGEEDDVEYFASSHLLAGGEGDLYYAARDTNAGRAYVYYYFNF